jgi:hypothetical protein
MIEQLCKAINRVLIHYDIKCPCGAWKIFARRSKIKLGEIIFEHTSKSYPVEVNLRTCRRCGLAYQHKNRIVKIKDAPTPIVDGDMEYTGPHLLTDGDMEAPTPAAWTAGNGAILTKEPGSPSGIGTQVLKIAYNGVVNPVHNGMIRYYGGEHHESN